MTLLNASKYASKLKGSCLLSCLTGLTSLALVSLPMGSTIDAVASETAGTENILRAVRGWSHQGLLLPDDSIITNSTDAPQYQPGVSYFPVNGHDGLLSGEDAQARWPIYLTASDLASPVSVKIGFTNSATVLPEASKLYLFVNGQRIATKALRYPDQTGYLEAQIPAAFLTIGRNELLLQAEQHHRIDCSLEGSYDLWTAIDFQHSTLHRSEATGRIGQLQDLAAISRSADQAVAVNLLLPVDGKTNDAHKETLLSLAQKAVLAAQIKKPFIQVVTDNSLRPAANSNKAVAIDLFAGSINDLKQNTTLQSLYPIGDAHSLIQGQTYNVALITSVDSERVLLAQIDELAHLPDGFAFLAQRVKTNKLPQEESSISLNELGYSEREYAGQRFAETIQLTLPADFYPADYDSLDFHLFASYAKTIKRGEVQLLINGQSKISLPIRKQDDGLIEDRLIKLPLSAFSAGVNQIEIVGLFQKNDVEAQCATRINRTREAMFFLSGESYFKIPKLAHLPVLPNVRTTLTTGFPYRAQDGENTSVSIEIHDEAARGLKIAADFLTRLSLNSEQVFKASLARESSTTGDKAKNRIIVGSYASIPAKHARFQQGVDLISLAKASQIPGNLGNSIDPMPTASIDSTAKVAPPENWSEPPGQRDYSTAANQQTMPPLPQQPSSALAKDSLKAVFRKRAERERDGFQFSDFSTSLQTWINPISGAVAKVTQLDSSPASLSGNNKALISQNRVDGQVTTLVSYNGLAADYLDFDSLFASTSKGSAPIHTVSISGYGETLTQLKSDDQWIGNLPLDHSRNWHLVFAGWLSNNPPFYAFLTFVSLLAFGLLSSVILNRTKRSNGDDFEQTY